MEKTKLTPVELQCVDGTRVVITGARRVHHTNLDHGRWTYMVTILATVDGEELKFDDASDILHFEYVRDEVANKSFRVLDDPGEMWTITASDILKFVAAAAVEEVVKEAKEEVAEAA